MLLFPVAVTVPASGDTPEQFWKPAKVYAHDGTTEVYVWNRDTQAAEMVLEIPGEPEPAGFRQRLVGDVLIAETGGCGCGHPLKRWSPPRPIRG